MSENNTPEPPPQPQTPPHGTVPPHGSVPPPGYGQPYSQPAPVLPMLESEARMWSMLTHILTAAVMVVSAGTLAFAVPLVLWLVHRQRSALVDFHGKQALNLQLTVIVAAIGAVVLGLLLFFFGLFLTLPVFIGYAIYALVISIVAGVKANEGQYYRIPFIIRFVR